MKASIALLLMVFAAQFSMACEPAEAQFSAEVTEYKVLIDENGEMDCSVKIGNFTHFTESGVCPLSQSEVENLYLPYPSCAIGGRKKVSGYISLFKDGRIDW